jgi:tRNA U34 2-thiouridine synthase MnmA/TrmU
MRAIARQPGVTITEAEWSSDMGDHEGTFRYLVFTQNGNGLREAFTPGPYRCVTAPLS